MFSHTWASIKKAALGLQAADLFPASGNDKAESGPSILVEKYDYVDEVGKLIFQTLRYHPKDFRQRRPDGHGGWIYNLEGTRRVLYHLPEVLAAKTVFFVEGEQDADRLRELGLTATTSPGGANAWRDEYAQFLRGKNVIILPDNDEAGEAYAQKVARSVLAVEGGVA